MRTTILLSVMCIGATGLIAQSNLLEETLVESPRYNPKVVTHDANSSLNKTKKSAIYPYLQKSIEYPYDALTKMEEGVVVVKFMVLPDGSLANMVVQNKVYPSLDQCVIELLVATSGDWLPGRVNGKPEPMYSKVYVKFDIEGNRPHKEIAMRDYLSAQKHIDNAQRLQLEGKAKQKRIANRYLRALAKFDEATKYCPEELSVISSQVLVYQQLDDYDNYMFKQAEFEELSKGVSEEEPEMIVVWSPR